MKQITNIYLSSAKSKSGKTEIGVGLGLKLQELGYKVSYFKPVGIRKGKEHLDPEVSILAKIFEQEESEVCSFFIDPIYFDELRAENLDELRKRLYAAYKKLKDKSDVVIIEGTKKVNQLISFNLDDVRLSKLFDNSPILAVNPFNNDLDIADVLMQKEYIENHGGTYLGCILNHVPKIMVMRLEQEFIPYLGEKGITVHGIVEREVKLSAPTFREIMNTLNAKLLDEDPSTYNLDVLVDSVLVGAMSAHSALSYFRKSCNKVIITGGDRADIVVSALETDLAGIVLTGNLYPDLRVISAAKEKNVPIVLVPFDTFTTASKVNETVAELQINERVLCKELVEKHVKIEALVDELANLMQSK
ncbi:MAG: DRTGG domain-containing protein [Promethearchaeota archaeon]